MNEEIPGRRLHEFVAAERQNGDLTGSVDKLVQFIGSAQEDGVVGVEILLRQHRIDRNL